MAEEAGQEEAAAAPPSPQPIRYIVLIVLVMLIEAGGGYLFLDRVIPVREVAPVETEAETEVRVSYEKPVFFSDLKDIIINPAPGNTLVKVDLVLKLGPGTTKAAREELTLKRDLLWDRVLNSLERLSVREIRDPQKVKLREAVTKVVNTELRNGSIDGVYVTDIVLQ